MLPDRAILAHTQKPTTMLIILDPPATFTDTDLLLLVLAQSDSAPEQTLLTEHGWTEQRLRKAYEEAIARELIPNPSN